MKDENVFQKLFGGLGILGTQRIPLRSNVFGRGRGSYSKIGQTGARLFDSDRSSPLLGSAQPSNKISGWLERIAELKQYKLLSVTKTGVNFFKDYVLNFLNISSTGGMITILDEEGNEDTIKTERINAILDKDIKLFDYIRAHIDEGIFYGAYYSLLRTKRDDTGHLKFHVYDLYDPVSTLVKRTLDPETDEIVEEYVVRGEDGAAYNVPDTEAFHLFCSSPLRLVNDLREDHDPWSPDSKRKAPGHKKDATEKPLEGNRDKVLQKESYSAGEPLFYTNILKIKELVVKDLLVSLLSLRDLISPSLLAISLDKGISEQSAQDLTSRIQRLLNSTNDLASFISSSFDVTSLIETTLTQSCKVIPDFNASLQQKGLISTDKLSDKYLELLQSLDQAKSAVLGPIGIPASLISEAQASKWSILASSELANSRVFSIMTSIKESVIALVRTIYKILYQDTLDPSLVKVHIFQKSTVEYNNTLNSIESVSGVINGISGAISTATQLLEQATPLLDTKAAVSYIQNLLKSADPDSAGLITEDSINQYVDLMQKKLQAQLEQMGIG